MATSAASALAGNADGAGAGGENKGGEAPAADPNAGTIAAAPEKPWYEEQGVDPRFHDAIKAKGWGGPNDVLDSYTGIEKLVSLERGGDVDRILVKPKADATPEEIAAFRDKAGFTAPADAKDYGFTDEQIAAAPIIGEAAKWFQEAGVPKDVAASIVDKAMQSEAQSAEQFRTQSDNEYRELSQQMGDKFGDFEEAGRRAFRASGLDAEGINKIEMAIGTKNMMGMFAKFGAAMTEASAPQPGRTGGGQFTQSAENAQSRIKTLQTDSDFQARLLSPNPQMRKAAQDEWEALHKTAYPPAQ